MKNSLKIAILLSSASVFLENLSKIYAFSLRNLIPNSHYLEARAYSHSEVGTGKDQVAVDLPQSREKSGI